MSLNGEIFTLDPNELLDGKQEVDIDTKQLPKTLLQASRGKIKETLNDTPIMATATGDKEEIEEKDDGEKNEIEKEESEELKLIRKQLNGGEIPPLLMESWRLVPFESEAGQQFQQEVSAFAQALYETHAERNRGKKPNGLTLHDFQKHPVRFFLSKKKEPNAWFVLGSNPPIVVFTEGLFASPNGEKSKNRGEEQVVCLPDEFALVLCHEITHMKVRSKYGNVANSKIEEGVAYALPLDILYSNNLNPELAPPFFEKLLNYHSKQRDFINELIDDHPTDENIQMILNNYLAYLRKEKGELKPKQSSEPYTEQSPIFQAIKRAEHVSYIATQLQQIPGYAALPVANKLQTCKSLLQNLQEPYPIRIYDLAQEIGKIKAQVNPDQDKKLVHDFANTVLEFIEKNGYLGEKLYTAISSLLASKEMKVLGRLRKIQRAAREFVDSAAGEDDDNIVACAEAFVAAVEQEPLFETQEGRAFLQKMPWPQFHFPDVDKFHKRKRRDKIRKRNGDDFEPHEEQVSWLRVRELACEDENVAKAALLIGLGRDPAIHVALQGHKELAKKVYSEPGFHRYDIPYLVRQISGGPHDDSTTIDNLKLNEDGVILDINFENEIDSNIEHERFEIILTTLSELAVEDFENAKDDPEAAERLRSTASNLQVLYYSRGEQTTFLFFLEQCEKNFDLFIDMNNGLFYKIQLGKELVERFEVLSKLMKREELKNMIIEFYRRMDLCAIIDNSLASYDPVEFRSIKEDPPTEKLRIRWNPFIQFLQKDPCDLFTKEEQYDLLEHNLRNYLHTQLPAMNGKRARGVIEVLSGIMEQAGHTEILQESTWKAYCRRVAHNKHDGRPDLCQLMTLYRVVAVAYERTPSLNEITEFVESAGSKTVRHLTSLTRKLQPIVTQKTANIASRKDLISAVRQWRLFSDSELFKPDKEYEYLTPMVERVSGEGNPKMRMQLAEMLLCGERILVPKCRRSLITIWSGAVKEVYGEDDCSTHYRGEMQKLVERMQKSVSRIDHMELFGELAKQIQAQWDVGEDLETQGMQIGTEDFKNAPLAGTFSDTVIQLIRKAPDARDETLRYLMSPYSDESVSHYREEIKEFLEIDQDYQNHYYMGIRFIESQQAKRANIWHMNQKTDQNLKHFYENFWAAPLEARAVIARELLIPTEESHDGLHDKTFDYAIEKTFSDKGAYQEEARHLIRAYVDALPDYQKHIALSAMMVAAEKTSYKGGSVGEALALFLENMGPAETKAGQVAESHPNVPEDIRKDLRRLKFHADEPYRWDILRWIKNIQEPLVADYNRYLDQKSLPKGNDLDHQGRVYVKRVADVLGSGSLFVAVEVEMSDGTKQVLALLRPHAQERAEAGFSTMRKMTENLGADHNMVETLQELIDGSNRKLEIETDCSAAPLQYGKACEMYNGATVSIDGENFRFAAADVTASGNQFFLMKKMKGTHFLDVPEKTPKQREEKKKRAIAVLVVELNNILRGEFDNDRHGGNVKTGNHTIGHFDFKAMSLEKWSQEGFDQFAKILFNVIQKTQSVQEFTNTLLAEQKALRDRGSHVDPFVTEAQKAILSLGEYVRLLEPQDLQRVLLSALSQGIDKRMETAVMKLFDLMPPMIQEAIKTFLHNGSIPAFLPFPIKEEDLIKIHHE